MDKEICPIATDMCLPANIIDGVVMQILSDNDHEIATQVLRTCQPVLSRLQAEQLIRLILKQNQFMIGCKMSQKYGFFDMSKDAALELLRNGNCFAYNTLTNLFKRSDLMQHAIDVACQTKPYGANPLVRRILSDMFDPTDVLSAILVGICMRHDLVPQVFSLLHPMVLSGFLAIPNYSNYAASVIKKMRLAFDSTQKLETMLLQISTLIKQKIFLLTSPVPTHVFTHMISFRVMLPEDRREEFLQNIINLRDNQ